MSYPPCPSLPLPIGQTSDGYHTFDELYEHRHALFLALMRSNRQGSWFAKVHEDGTMMEGWFIAGITLNTGPITYHLPMALWSLASKTGAEYRKNAPRWDGHTPSDVIKRLHAWIEA